MDSFDLLDNFSDDQPVSEPTQFRTIGQLVDAGLETILGLARKAGISRTVIRRQLLDQGGVSLNSAVRLSDAVSDVAFEVGGRLYQVVLLDSQGSGEEALPVQFEDAFVTARIDHACSSCQNDIPAGEEYRKRVYRTQEGFVTEKTCPHCQDGRYRAREDGTSVHEGHQLANRDA